MQLWLTFSSFYATIATKAVQARASSDPMLEKTLRLAAPVASVDAAAAGSEEAAALATRAPADPSDVVTVDAELELLLVEDVAVMELDEAEGVIVEVLSTVVVEMALGSTVAVRKYSELIDASSAFWTF